MRQMPLNRRALLGAGLAGIVMSYPLRRARAQEWISQSGGVAIAGYDPTTYTGGRPAAGNPRHGLMWQGATWFFASPDTRARFEADPHGYAPQFGGYCARSMADGVVAISDPREWEMRGGRLFLFHSAALHADWNRDPRGYVAAASTHWPGVLK